MGLSWRSCRTAATLAASLALCVTFVSLAIAGIIHLPHLFRHGLRNQEEIQPYPDNHNITAPEWQYPVFDLGAQDFSPPEIQVLPFLFDINITKFQPNCSSCVRKVASFLTPHRCYFKTRDLFPFEDCFDRCRSYSQCYYFYTPSSDTSLIQYNLKQGEEMWVGAFRLTNSSRWQDIFDANVQVDDIYESYCAYLPKVGQRPRSYFDCEVKRPCLCAGQSDVPAVPILKATHRRPR